MVTAPPLCIRCGSPLHAKVRGLVCPRCLASGLFGMEDNTLESIVATAAAAPLRAGDYEMTAELGRGGMGVVFRARHVHLNRPAAVKLILTGALASPSERQRFVAEAEATAALDHPGIVSIYEAGEEDGEAWFAMQLIEGESLSERLRRTGEPLPLREAVRIIHGTALAVQHAHERGFLHRDLKPANILLDAAGAPHVTDFGLARRTDDESRLTLTGAVLGTPSYMAPEQADTRQPPTTAVDIYSLGAILYEMVGGRPPFTEKSLPELFLAIREKEPASLRALCPEVDRDLDTACRKCLEKEPARRYRTAAALAEDLQHWLQGEPVMARAAGRAERLWRWCRRRPAVAGLTAAAVLLLFGGAGGIAWQWRRANKEAAAAVQSLHTAEEALWKSNVSEARALIISRERGQRSGSLKAIRAAAAFRPTVDLRNQAIAALALPDFGEPVFFPPVPENAWGVRLSTDLTRLAFRANDYVILQNLSDGAEIARFKAAGAGDFNVTPDFAAVAVLSETENGSGEYTITLTRSADHVNILELRKVALGQCFSGDSRRLVLHRDGQLEVRDAATGDIVSAGPCSFRPVRLAVNPGCTHAVLLGERTAEWWSLFPPEKIRVLPRTEHPLYDVTWHPSEEMCVATGNDSVYRVTPGLDAAPLITRHDREGTFALMHPSGQLILTGSWDGQLRCFSPLINSPFLKTAGWRPLDFSEDGSRLAVSVGTKPGICSVTPPDIWRCLPVGGGESPGMKAMGFSSDGKWLAIVQRNGLIMWDTETLRRTPALPLEDATGGRFSGPRTFLVAESAKGLSEITLTSGADGVPVLRRTGHTIPIGHATHTFACAPDGRRMLACGRGQATCVDWEGRELFRLAADPLMGNPAWSPDGRWLASGYWNNSVSAGSSACVWSAADGHLLKKIPAGNCEPFFTPDGSRLVISSTHQYVEYETATWQEIRRYPREASGLDHGAAAFAPAGNLMAVMADESTVRLLDLPTGEELARLTSPFPHKLSTFGLAFSGDGHWLACEAGRVIRLWNIRLLRERLADIGLDWSAPARASQ